MKFFADECCDAELVARLRTEGYDVLYSMEFKPGALDNKVLCKALNLKLQTNANPKTQPTRYNYDQGN